MTAAGPAFDVLVLDARLRQALVAVRSLGRHGLEVAALNAVARVPAFSSRWCHLGVVCPYEDATEGYLDALTRLLDRTDVRVVLPLADQTLALLRRHRASVERRAAVAMADEPALAVAVDKYRTLDLARSLGISVPATVVVSKPGEIDAALAAVGPPAVIKPSESWLWTGDRGVRLSARCVTSRAEARRVVDEITGAGGGALFQPLLTGRREAVSLLYAEDRVHARFAQWAERTEPPLGGVSVLRQSIPVPDDIGEPAEHLVRAMKLEGYAEVEFRRDAAGTAYLMEVNPRLSASVEIAVRCGVDFPYLLYQWARGGPVDTVTTYRVGRWMRYLAGDIMTTLGALRQHGRPDVPAASQALRDFCFSFLRRAGYDSFDAADPVATILATATFTREWLGPAIKKRLPRLRRSRHRPPAA